MAIDPIGTLRNASATGGAARSGGSGGGFAAVLEQASAGKPVTRTAYQELQDYVDMTPAQRMRADLLKKLGLTEDDLAAMPADERQGVEAKLRELVQQQIQEAQQKQQAQQARPAGTAQATKRIDVVA